MPRPDSDPPLSAEETECLRRGIDEAMIRYAGAFTPLIVTRASGAVMIDERGRRVLDFTSGQMCAVLGHNHPDITAAIHRATREVTHLLSTILAPSVIRLCQRLGALVPDPLAKSMLLNTGAEANEAAIRMAKLFTGGFEVVSFGGSWHGMTGGAFSSTFSFGRQGYGPLMPGTGALPAPNCYRCPIRHCTDRCDTTCLEVGFELIDRQTTGAPAAVIVEPVLSAAGIIDLGPGYLAKLKTMANDRGYLLILDEAQTAFGRVGDLFAFERDGVPPDILTLSKTLGGGLPLAATVTSAAIEERCHQAGFLFLTSHVSDPLPAYVGLAVLEIIERDRIVERARETGRYLREQLEALRRAHECIGDVRGRGMLLGMEIVLDRERKTPAPELGHQIMDRCLELGLSMNIVRHPKAGSIFRIAPPLTIERPEVDEGVAILDQAIGECWRAGQSSGSKSGG
ncbi:MAG: aspartate aminotransferase family protein [Gemmatimonadetes bacterium]|nr:aspartate aminotransferase family protein [Gemmatimonadota bacterium]